MAVQVSQQTYDTLTTQRGSFQQQVDQAAADQQTAADRHAFFTRMVSDMDALIADVEVEVEAE